MSICELMNERATPGPTTEEKLLNIQNELLWGLKYRDYKENEMHRPMTPMRSPLDIPFELCRAEMFLQRKGVSKIEPSQELAKGEEVSDKQSPSKTSRAKKRKISDKQPPSNKTTLKRKRKSSDKKLSPASKVKPTLLDRSVWPQSKYMDFLSIPNPKFCEDPSSKQYKKRCELEPCPPRFVQLAVPNKRRVFANWKEYAHFLPTEMLIRYEEILHTDQNLEPREARYYYKKLDREKRKKLRKKRRLQKKKKQAEEKDDKWLNEQIDKLAKDIMDYIQDEPLFALNYKQMLLSDGILNRLEKTKTMKKPSRKTKSHYKKTVIEASDKFAIWIDTLTRFVDVQAIESDQDIPPLSIASLGEEGEGEGETESDYDYSSDEEIGDEKFFEEDLWGEEGDDRVDDLSGKEAESIIEGIFKPGEGEEMGDLDGILGSLDEDILEKLIQILSNCSDEFLDKEIDDDKMPDVKYRDVLDRLKALKDCLTAEGKKPFLEQIMIDWAIQNDPDNVTDEILQKIREVACLLGDLPSPARSPIKEEPPDESEEGVEAEEGVGAEEGLEEVKAEEGLEEVKTEEGIEEPTSEEGVEEPKADDVEEGDVKVDEESKIDEPPLEEKEDEVKPPEEPEEEVAAPKEEEAKVEEPKGDEDQEEDIKPVEEEGESEEAEEGAESGASKGTLLDGFTESEGVTSPFEIEGSVSEFEKELSEEEFIKGMEGEGEEEEEIAVIFEPGAVVTPGEEIKPEEEVRLEGKVIKGHKPTETFEHSPDTVCCLSLKTWAVWLLEITHNAHNWTQWMGCIIQKVREYAAIVRGDVKDSDGRVKVLRKAEWRQFIKETEESVVAWRQYSAHVKDLSQSITETFHGKKINCCPKCLQDHLITNVVVAHDTLQALTEAISCAAYWQRCLDTLMSKACGLTRPSEGEKGGQPVVCSSEESVITADLEEVESEESVYEIEGLDSPSQNNVKPE